MATPTTEQLAALVRLWSLAQENHGTAKVALRLILGCYNGRRFLFDLTDLRLLDDGDIDDALAVLRMDSSPQREVHELLNAALGRRDAQPRLELLAFDWRIPGAVKNAEVPSLRARLQPLPAPADAA